MRPVARPRRGGTAGDEDDGGGDEVDEGEEGEDGGEEEEGDLGGRVVVHAPVAVRVFVEVVVGVVDYWGWGMWVSVWGDCRLCGLRGEVGGCTVGGETKLDEREQDGCDSEGEDEGVGHVGGPSGFVRSTMVAWRFRSSIFQIRTECWWCV